jgi:CubicO group peptidase (beta-lactamase class C family)
MSPSLKEENRMSVPYKKCLIFLILALILSKAALPKAQTFNRKTDLDAFIASFIEENNLAGLSACLIKNNVVVWQRGFGWANIEDKIAVTPDTLFMLASVSKTVTGAALLCVFDQGKFKLDDDIGGYIPFRVRNPNFPDIPITFRMLLNHSSSLIDNSTAIDSLYKSGDSSDPSLEDLVKSFFVPGGKYYDLKNFDRNPPSEKWVYGNMNYVLISYLVERLSGKSFSAYCQENIFKPLKMEESSWFLSGLNPAHIAFNYLNDDRTPGAKRRIAHYGWPGYADGCLRTSVPQYANFVRMLMNHGNFEGKQVLRPETISAIFTRQNLRIGPEGKALAPTMMLLDMGLTWHVYEMNSRVYFGHTGGGTGGVSAFTVIDPSSRSGFIAMVTGPASLKFLSLISKLAAKIQE